MSSILSTVQNCKNLVLMIKSGNLSFNISPYMILYVQLATYQGGGSYQNLHYMQNISTLILDELKTSLWIDRATRYNTENK